MMADHQVPEGKSVKYLAHFGIYSLLILTLFFAHIIITSLPASSAITGMAVSQEPALDKRFDWSPFLGFSYVLFGVLLAGIVLKMHQERNLVPAQRMEDIPCFIRKRYAEGQKKERILHQLVKAGWASDVATEIYASYERKYNSS
ncbi:MAG: hypothetical protein V1743_03770 [Nanoarchaeota archaeon]